MSVLIIDALCLFFAWLFGRASIHKLSAPSHYRQLMASYVSIPGAGSALLVLVIAVELSLVALLLAPGLRTTGLGGCAILLLVYTGLMAWQLWRGRVDTSCGCAGANSTLVISAPLILRNLVCALFAVTAGVYASVGEAWSQPVLACVLTLIMISGYLLFEQSVAHAQFMNEDV